MHELDNHLDLENRPDAADGIVSLRDVYADSRARGHTVTRNPMLATSDNERNSEHLHSIDGDTNGLGSLDIAMSTNPLKTRLSGNVMEEDLNLAMQGTVNPLFMAGDDLIGSDFSNRPASFVEEVNPLRKLGPYHAEEGVKRGLFSPASFFTSKNSKVRGIQSIRNREAPSSAAQDVIPISSLEAITRSPPGPPTSLGDLTRAPAPGGASSPLPILVQVSTAGVFRVRKKTCR